MAQVFYADPRHTFTWKNGAVGFRSGMPFDCLGPFAKVRNCPVMVGGAEVRRLTCYATGYADTAFSIPACTRLRGKHVRGYFTERDGGAGIEFRVLNSHKHLFENLPCLA